MPIEVTLVSGDTIEVGTGRVIPGNHESTFVDPTWNASRSAFKPIDYAMLGQVLGHYRVVSKSGATLGLAASAVLASLRWVDATRFFVLLRLAAQAYVTVQTTTATPIDLASYVFRGSTGNSSGTGSSTITFTGDNQKSRKNMGSSLLAAGELRTVGTTTALTAAAGKTNDGAPFGQAMLPMLNGTNVTGAVVILPIGSGCNLMVDLYVPTIYSHPLILQANEGIEIQAVTTPPATTGGINYMFVWEWAEVAAF
jgi:hypothetical protein